MTICIFDGKNLVADKRRTNKTSEDPHFRYSEAKKIITYSDTYWEKDNKLLAITAAGYVKHVEEFLKIIKISDQDNVQKDVLYSLDRQIAIPDISVILITEKFSMLYSGGGLKKYNFKSCRKNPLIIGATTIIGATIKGLGLKLTAIEMAYIGSLYSRSIGDGLDVWSLKTGKCRYIKDLPAANKQKLATMVADKFINGSLSNR